MQQLGKYQDERAHDQLIEKILDLKMSKTQTQGTKLQIQRLQQELEDVEARLDI